MCVHIYITMIVALCLMLYSKCHDNLHCLFYSYHSTTSIVMIYYPDLHVMVLGTLDTRTLLLFIYRYAPMRLIFDPRYRGWNFIKPLPLFPNVLSCRPSPTNTQAGRRFRSQTLSLWCRHRLSTTQII